MYLSEAASQNKQKSKCEAPCIESLELFRFFRHLKHPKERINIEIMTILTFLINILQWWRHLAFFIVFQYEAQYHCNCSEWYWKGILTILDSKFQKMLSTTAQD